MSHHRLENLTLLRVYADGRTVPSVPSGTEIILIQDGEVSLGKLILDHNDLSIEHPTNETDLIKITTDLLLKKNSDLFKKDVTSILTCPIEISNLMNW